MKIKAVRFVMVTVLLLLLVSQAASQVPDDKLIVPGVRIGKWTLEMTMADLLRLNGERNGAQGRAAVRELTTADAPPDLWIHAWNNLGFFALTLGRESQTVVQLVVRLGEFKTDRGIGPGASKDAIQTAYGQPTVVTVPEPGWSAVIYDEIGLAFDVNPNNVAMNSSIFRKGTVKQLYKY